MDVNPSCCESVDRHVVKTPSRLPSHSLSERENKKKTKSKQDFEEEEEEEEKHLH